MRYTCNGAMLAANSRLFQAVSVRLRPFPVHQRIAHYYVRPKKRKGASTQAWLALAGVTTTLTGTGIYLLGRPEENIAGLETGPDKYANENVLKAYLYRAWDRIAEFRRMFVDPSSEKLLPDLLPPPYQRPYTLVIELNDVLLHSEYDRGVGWTYQKRPGVDALLMQLFDLYEIVIFTSENAITANPLVSAMDPNQLIIYSLYRDSTKYINGHHIKDLTNLNRPLSKVIIIDTDPKSVKFHRENSIILDKWAGDIHDRTLWDLVPFLQTIAANDVDDVRPVLDFYKSQGEKQILETFKVNQERLQEEEMERQRMAQKSTKRAVGGAISTFSFGAFSRSSRHHQGEDSSTLPSAIPPTSTDSPSPTAQDTSDSDSSAWSVTKWVGSWLGWK